MMVGKKRKEFLIEAMMPEHGIIHRDDNICAMYTPRQPLEHKRPKPKEEATALGRHDRT